MELQLEVNANGCTDDQPLAGAGILVTPPVGEDYWQYRVKVSENQSVIGFPKFMTIGIGFAKEDADWNTNLPYSCDTEEIYNHIEKNKGDKSIPRERCIEAIRMIQEAAQDFMSDEVENRTGETTEEALADL